MQKRGQFYLIAALVIIGVLAGLTTMYNTTKTSQEDLTVFDISEYLHYEGLQVVSSGVFNDLGDAEIIDQIHTLINASAQQNPSHDFIGIYGNETSLTIMIFTRPEAGGVSLILGEEPIVIAQTDLAQEIIQTIERPESGTIVIEIGEEQYFFEIDNEETFYLIVKKERGEETFVDQGGSEG